MEIVNHAQVQLPETWTVFAAPERSISMLPDFVSLLMAACAGRLPELPQTVEAENGCWEKTTKIWPVL